MIRYLFIIPFLFSCNIENKSQKSHFTDDELFSIEDSLKIVNVMKNRSQHGTTEISNYLWMVTLGLKI